MNLRSYRLWLLALFITAVLAGCVAAYTAFTALEATLTHQVEARTGFRCRLTSLRPCLPFGIKISGLALTTASGEPLLQANEVSVQINPVRYLLNKNNRPDLIRNLSGDGLTVQLTRRADGTWNIPSMLTAHTQPGPGATATPPRRQLAFTNLTVTISTEKGAVTRAYRSLDIDLHPAQKRTTAKLTGTNESLQLSLHTGSTTSYELVADNFSLAPCTPVISSPLPLENLIVHGTGKATRRANDSLGIEGTGTIKLTSLQHKVLATHAVEDISLPLELTGLLTPAGFELSSGTINLAGEKVQLHGRLDNWKKPVVSLSAAFNDFSYSRAFAAFPPTLHPDLPVIRLSGKMTGTFRLHLDTSQPSRLDYRYTGQVDQPRIIDLGQQINIELLKGPFRHQVRTTTGRDVSILLGTSNPDFVPITAIPTALVSAVITAEDGSFFSHKGFSKKHIRDSIIENMKAGKVVRGASTISMQLAKNLYLGPERTLSRKLEEALITVALEQQLDKKRMLEIYLNIIEWGNGIYGIGPASRHYFGKPPHELKAVECAFLASIIARPRNNWRPDPLQKLGNGWWDYLRVILCKMYEMGEADLDDLLEAGVSETRISSLRKGDGSRLARRL